MVPVPISTPERTQSILTRLSDVLESRGQQGRWWPIGSGVRVRLDVVRGQWDGDSGVSTTELGNPWRTWPRGAVESSNPQSTGSLRVSDGPLTDRRLN